MPHNKVGAKFNLALFYQVREIAIEVVNSVAGKVFEGMSEEQGIELINIELAKHKVQKNWHPHKFRIGKNTTKSFKELSDLSIRLKNGDLFFIDIGPVLFDHEADFGNTFIFGKGKHLEFPAKAKELFDLGSKLFKENNLSGLELYAELKVIAQKLNLELHPNTLGHRLGDFPHQLFYKGKLIEIEGELVSNLWVLEILIVDNLNEVGAFYEDILIK